MKKLKEVWKGMTKQEKTLVGIRDMACFCLLVVALLTALGLIPNGAPIAWLLTVIAISQAMLSWKQSKPTALFFLGFLAFYLFLFFVGRG